MKFRYYITDIGMGCVDGTNDRKVALNLANCEDFFVVDAEEGVWLVPEGRTEEVKEVEVYE